MARQQPQSKIEKQRVSSNEADSRFENLQSLRVADTPEAKFSLASQLQDQGRSESFKQAAKTRACGTEPFSIDPAYSSSAEAATGEGSSSSNSQQQDSKGGSFSDSGVSISWEPSLHLRNADTTVITAEATNYAKNSQWTRTGWTASNIRHHMQSVFSNDYLPSCMLSSSLMLEDYANGNTRYCSAALVNALLCLATHHGSNEYGHDRNNERNDDTKQFEISRNASTTAWLFDEARSGLENASTLPDIQALGVLAMYQLQCGHESEARNLAENFGDAMTNLCLRELHATTKGERYRLVRASSYCAAISLIRFVRILSFLSRETVL